MPHVHLRSPAFSALVALLFAGTLGLTPAASAAPSNDPFAVPQILPGAEIVTTTNVGATKEPGEPPHAGDDGGASIWFTYTASGDGSVVLTTTGSDFDTLLAVYTGDSLDSLTLIAASDDEDSGAVTSHIDLLVDEGTVYRIAVDGKAGAVGTVVLQLDTDLPACDVIGTTEADMLAGTGGSETICGLAGADRVNAGSGSDVVLAGRGDDVLLGGGGDDRLVGGEGTDRALFGASVVANLVTGEATGEGRDELVGIEGLAGGKGSDRFIGDVKPNGLSGGGGSDLLVGAGGDDLLSGGAGRDRLIPNGGNDSVLGGPDDDSVSYEQSGRGVSVDLAFGRAIAEGIDALKGVERVVGSIKSDTIRGSGAPNDLDGGRGDDTINGLGGNDSIAGGDGADRIYSGGGRDRIWGGGGPDACYPSACERRLSFDDWLPLVNFYRATASLPRVMENPSFSAGDLKHARYVVKTDQAGHIEDPNNPWYSEAGAIAGGSSNVYWSTSTSQPDRTPIDYWMAGPFHAAGMLNPGLGTTGYGVYRESSSQGFRMAAALNTLQGLEAPRETPDYPIRFPGPGSKVPLSRFPGNEVPDPLTSCSGYRAPTGLPVLIFFADAPRLDSASFSRGSQTLPSCSWEGRKYNNPDQALEGLGRAVLGNAIVVIPRAPLGAGRYTVNVRANGDRYEWSFRVSG